MCKYISPYRIKTILAGDGERIPTLIDRESGIPIFDSVLWVVSSLRNKGLASETISQALKSISILFIVLNREDINLNERLRRGALLNPSEIELVINACKYKLEFLLQIQKMEQKFQKSKVTLLEKSRMVMTRTSTNQSVSGSTVAIRLGYIREFLRFKINDVIIKSPQNIRSNLIELSELIDQEIKNKTPSATRRKSLYQRMGLLPEAQKLLLSILNSDACNNLWHTTHTQFRNRLIILMLLDTGIRRSELLGVRIRDINAQGNEISIFRRPDDPEDPRLIEPNAKTRDRLLPLSAGINKLINEYISIRRKIVKGRHDFLLVANGTGNPLSKSEFNRIFKSLKEIDIHFQDLCPHKIRHTYFENICESLDKNGGDLHLMESILTQLGGWTEGSISVQIYTKRYSQTKALEAAKFMQSNMRPF